MKRLLFPLLSSLFLLGIFGFASIASQQQLNPTVEVTNGVLPLTATSTVEAYDTSSVGDNESLIVQTLEKACTIEEQAQWTFNTEEYSTVFTNDARYPLSPNALDYVRDIKNDPLITDIGYLDFKIAQILRHQECTLKWKSITEAMEAENREQMTAEEQATLFTAGGRMCPAPTAPELKGNVPCIYAVQSIKIQEDTATVVASLGATTDEWYFVRKDGRWFIAGRKVLIRHP
ncbi:MAG: hypothetical protein OHK0052_00350 [Anaerolineales bacterium]